MWFNKQKINKYLIFILLMSMSIDSYSHQPDMSTMIISEADDGKCILQINSALTAFEGEIEYIYGKNAYKTPEEFKDLVISHFKKNFILIINEHERLTFSNPLVLLGHDTRLVVELLGLPKNIKSIQLKSTLFKDIPRNQTLVIMLKTGFPDKQYILNNENKQEIYVVQNDGKWNSLNHKKNVLTKENLLIILPLIVLLLYLFVRFKKKRPSNI